MVMAMVSVKLHTKKIPEVERMSKSLGDGVENHLQGGVILNERSEVKNPKNLGYIDMADILWILHFGRLRRPSLRMTFLWVEAAKSNKSVIPTVA